MKRAAAYKLNADKFFLHALSKTTAGVWILVEPIVAFEGNDVLLLGKHIVTVLDGSREGVPHPKTWEGRVDVLKAANIKSKTTFMNSAKCVEIKLEEKGFSFVPTKNVRTKGGFQHLNSKVAHIEDVAAEHVGEALLNAFKACE